MPKEGWKPLFGGAHLQLFCHSMTRSPADIALEDGAKTSGTKKAEHLHMMGGDNGENTLQAEQFAAVAAARCGLRRRSTAVLPTRGKDTHTVPNATLD